MCFLRSAAYSVAKTGGETALGNTRILIVEDEPSILESLGFILQRAGFEVDTATDGTDALNRLRRQTYSGLILDIMLPGMNGFDVLRAVRADKALVALPVIVLTAKGQAHEIGRASCRDRVCQYV